MDSNKAISIRVEFDDGRVISAQGKDASEIWKWIQSCEQFAWIHGCRYSGPMLQPETKK